MEEPAARTGVYIIAHCHCCCPPVHPFSGTPLQSQGGPVWYFLTRGNHTYVPAQRRGPAHRGCRKRTRSQRSRIPRSWTRRPTNQNSVASWTHAWAPSTGISSVRPVERACQSITKFVWSIFFIQVCPSLPPFDPPCLTHPCSIIKVSNVHVQIAEN